MVFSPLCYSQSQAVLFCEGKQLQMTITRQQFTGPTVLPTTVDEIQ
jgi:hypothetical protein